MYHSTILSALAFPFIQSVARPLFALCLLFWLLPSPLVRAQTSGVPQAAAQREAEARALKLGEPVERELAGGQSHIYQITLTAGQYLNVIVEQRGVDVVVTLFGPDGKKLREGDGLNGAQGLEPMMWIADVEGTYRLEVRSFANAIAAGRYEAKIVALRVAKSEDRTLTETLRLYLESNNLRTQRKYDEAIPLVEQALTLREKILGLDHTDVAPALFLLASLHRTKRDNAKAEQFYQRALTIYEKSLGSEHPELVAILNGLAVLYRDNKDYAKVEQCYQRALAISERSLGPQHTEVATILNNLAAFYRDRGDYAKAEPLYQRVLVIREKTLGPEHLDVATSLYNLALVYDEKGDYAKAEPLFQRALAIREKSLGSEHPNVASTLVGLAYLYFEKRDYLKAEPLYQRALAIQEKAFGLEHPNVANTLNSLGFLYFDIGDYAKAESLYQRALAIREKAYGREHRTVASSLIGLGELYSQKGEYPKAEVLCQRALLIMEKSLGPEHHELGRPLNLLGRLYTEKGDYAKAEPFFQRALIILEKALGTEHVDVASTLNNLALNYQYKGDYTKVEQLYQRALTIYEKVLGPEVEFVAVALNNIAWLYSDKGDYEKAEPLNQRALAIDEKALGPEHPETANTLINLGRLYQAKGNYAKAEPLVQRALSIYEKALGPEHPDVARAFSRLATLSELKGEITQAISFQSRASTVSERNLALNLATGSEREKLVYLAGFSDASDRTISLQVGAASGNAIARNLALTIILQRKGRALDAMTDSIATLRRRANASDRALLDQLQETNAQLSRLVLNGPQRITPAEHQARIKNLEEQKEKLEADISRRSAEFRAQTTPVTIEAVQAAIPAQAALVEFKSYRPFNAKHKKADEQFGAPHYVAYVLPHQGEAQWVELGEAKAIDTAIEKLRQALRDKRRRDVKQLARAVDEKVMRPVRALLGQTRRVFISPDGALNLIPFAALVDERNRYLVQRHDFSYLTSGRDLLRLQVKQPNKQTAMVVANPDFGEETKVGAAQQRLLVYRPGAKAVTGEGAVLAGAYFPPLRGTAGEARSLKAMLTDATVLTAAQATEAALKQVSGPRILHIATHGFFLENQKPAVVEERGLKLVSLEEPMAVGQIENPLLRSGLALADANRPTSGAGDDGILTAQEAAGLDLWGTKLVVLSACDTGVGEVKNGEGVYGLRRALVLAGSETQVMSLWPVSDKGTRDLMIEYYRRLLRGAGRNAALREVQLRMLTSQGRKDQPQARVYSHPYYWASFIQSGEWHKLD